MLIFPVRDDRDLWSRRRSLLDWEFPQMALMPFDQVFNWVERSRQSLHDDVTNMHRNLLSLEPFSAMDNAFNSVMQELSAIQPREFHPELEYTQPGELDFLKDAYEVGKDGKLHFKVYFNAKNFKPEEITIKTDKNKLIVRAQRSVTRGDASMSESVGRSIPLPPSVDRNHIQATLTSDDVLMVEAPVDAPNYKAIKLTPEKGLAIQPTEAQERQLAVTNKEGLEIVTADDGSKKMHLELKVDPHFAPKDVKVWAKGNKVYVHGVTGKEEKTEKASHSEHREFYKAFVTPEVVDASKTQAEMVNGHMVVEAPLFK
ncbi:Major egg antigen p40 [Echinococcus multilocularis]|uniref:Major egg antigen p40 n=2 Tax=Echinococcus multilocularis TaxID=6211 RepID=B5BV14_ECHMU|nr:putative hsp20 [Echinococcus multilocularis]CDI98285.1 Major egg antigen p40 [Echinococcus multilocularis]